MAAFGKGGIGRDSLKRKRGKKTKWKGVEGGMLPAFTGVFGCGKEQRMLWYMALQILSSCHTIFLVKSPNTSQICSSAAREGVSGNPDLCRDIAVRAPLLETPTGAEAGEQEVFHWCCSGRSGSRNICRRLIRAVPW